MYLELTHVLKTLSTGTAERKISQLGRSSTLGTRLLRPQHLRTTAVFATEIDSETVLELRTLEMEDLGDLPSPSKPAAKKSTLDFLLH